MTISLQREFSSKLKDIRQSIANRSSSSDMEASRLPNRMRKKLVKLGSSLTKSNNQTSEQGRLSMEEPSIRRNSQSSKTIHSAKATGKKVRFNNEPISLLHVHQQKYKGSTSYLEMESYEDLIIRVAKFNASDKRGSNKKIQDFLVRSTMYCMLTRNRQTIDKKKDLALMTMDERRIWKRLAIFNWNNDVDESTLDSGDEDLVLQLSKTSDLSLLLNVVNSCFSRGEYAFTSKDLDLLCHLEVEKDEVVEEDGWL